MFVAQFFLAVFLSFVALFLMGLSLFSPSFLVRIGFFVCFGMPLVCIKLYITLYGYIEMREAIGTIKYILYTCTTKIHEEKK